MNTQKDCKVVFCNKQIYEFNSENMVKALKYAYEKKEQVWVIETPWGVFQPMGREEYEAIFDAVMAGPCDEPVPEDLA